MHRKSSFNHSLHIAKNRNSHVNVSENVYLKFPFENSVKWRQCDALSFNFTRDCSLIQSAVTLFKLSFKVALLQQNCFRTNQGPLKQVDKRALNGLDIRWDGLKP